MSVRTVYSSGDWNAICDVCGRRYKDTDLRKRWDGLIVCPQDYEERQPQDFVRARADQMAVPWSRPEGQDTFVPINYTPTINEEYSFDEALAKAVAAIVPDEVLYTPTTVTNDFLGGAYLGENPLGGSGVANGRLSNGIYLSETLTFSKTFNETLSLSEVEVKSVSAVVAESITVAESIAKSVARALTDTATLSESQIKAVTKTIAESITPSEAVSVYVIENRSLGSQAIGITTLG